MRPGQLGLILGAALVVIGWTSLGLSESGTVGLSEVVHAGLAKLRLVDPLARNLQAIGELRLYKLLVSIGVGAALALSGALLQGVFRNQLASPSIIGVTAGASLGASVTIVLISSSAGFFLADSRFGLGPFLVTLAAFLGAIGATAIVTAFSTTGGRISVPTLLLVGIALNAIVGGAIAAIQRFAVEDADLMRALVTWTFGRLEDRADYHVAIIWVGLLAAIAVIPRVSTELDLFAAGEEDAHTLGVNTTRVKWLSLGCAALCAAFAVSVAGQIGFIGLIAPHALRRMVGPSHRHVLWLSLLAGPVLLCGTDLAQRLIFGHSPLPPGVIMSLIGGPFFLLILLRNRRAVEAW